ncbi:alpha-mannosidase [Alicyclobacillus acidiphilus]|uniref:alpha-mannosidase n=1 Tax=Alicyclobacillus acidiphilus TaxID=182455 RepID=UPI000830D2C7|nr:alpha-mannosidase [Alicyclobacillus acidiphilus]
MSKSTLHMIGNAHIDPVWLWQWQEGFQEVKATFRSALDRMKEYDDFVFVSSSAAFYEWVEENDPAMFDEIKARIAEGRWEVVGGWWIQPDCNIPSGESFVRQGLYGQRYFHDKFGVIAKTGYNVDSFGHHGMLPQILKKSGMDQYVFMRPGPHEKGLPGHVFWWESDDGSRVLTARILFEYCTWGKELDTHVRRCAEQLQSSVKQLMCFYGVGNHGGGPTKENLDSIHRLQEELAGTHIVISTPDRYFAALRKDTALTLPVVHDDLQHHASGCYAAHSGVKQWNRKAENLLLAAEKWSLLADWMNLQPYPQTYNQAWKDVMFNQFHDIMAGTSLEAAYDDARDFYGEAMSIASRGLNNAVQALSWRIDIPEEAGMKPIVVFNPHAWRSRVNVELECGSVPAHAVLVDDEERQVPFQLVQSKATSNGRYRLSFIADLPSLGYRVYRLRTEHALTKEAESFNEWNATETSFENPFFQIEFDPETGYISRLFDKQAEVEVFHRPGAVPIVMDDKSDTWSHGVLRFDREIGRFQAKRVRLLEHGAVKSVIRVTSEYGHSTLVQDFTLYRELRQIDVFVTVDWHEKHKALKLRFPTNISHSDATYEIPYGHIKRPVNGEEEPGQSWLDVTGLARTTGEPYGLSLLNDGKYSFDVLEKEIHLTVLRSPIYAHHDPLEPEEDGEYSFIDQGIQRFTYSLLPHQGQWQDARTVQTAAELNQKAIAVIETYHAGPLPQADSFLTVSDEGVMVSVVKRSEDGDAMIIRCVETSGSPKTATIALSRWNREFDASFGPCEIKTFRIEKDESVPVKETNLLEFVDGEIE